VVHCSRGGVRADFSGALWTHADVRGFTCTPLYLWRWGLGCFGYLSLFIITFPAHVTVVSAGIYSAHVAVDLARPLLLPWFSSIGL